jgi:hypothetical protein
VHPGFCFVWLILCSWLTFNIPHGTVYHRTEMPHYHCCEALKSYAKAFIAHCLSLLLQINFNVNLGQRFPPHAHEFMHISSTRSTTPAHHVPTGFLILIHLIEVCKRTRFGSLESNGPWNNNTCIKNTVFWDTETQFIPHRKHITSPREPNC